MWVVSPPDEENWHRGRVTYPAEDNALAPILRESALGGNSHTPSGRDDGEPVVDVVDLLDFWLAAGRPELGGGRAGSRVDGEHAAGEVCETEVAAPSQRVVHGQCAVARLQAYDGAVEPAEVDAVRCRWSAYHSDVADTLCETAGR